MYELCQAMQHIQFLIGSEPLCRPTIKRCRFKVSDARKLGILEISRIHPQGAVLVVASDGALRKSEDDRDAKHDLQLRTTT